MVLEVIRIVVGYLLFVLGVAGAIVVAGMILVSMFGGE